MALPRWTDDDIPDQSERVMVVTGANSGLGYETCRALAHRGAHVIMACRSLDKARDAAHRLEGENITGQVEAWALDLADLGSIEAFAERFESEHDHLHGLCNNAGVMALPYGKTVDGFERQLGTNHLGHYALVGRLLSVLMATDGSRVVTVSSLMHRVARMRWDDLHGERRYRRWDAYGQSKLANLLFTFELHRRLEAAKAETIAVASHPGYAATNLQLAWSGRRRDSLSMRVLAGFNRIAAQSPAQGALPSLYALTADDVRGGEYFGPSGPMETRGFPTRVEASARANDTDAAAKLWAISQRQTGIRYDALSN
ncbi:MAG: oxidoreductase [Myxococcota bacterium]